MISTSADPRRAVRRPEGPRTHRQPRAGRALGRRRLHQRPAPDQRVRRVGGLRRAPRLRRRRRHPPHRLAAVRADRPLLHQGVRGRLQRQLLGAARRARSRWGSAAASVTKLEYAKLLAGCLTYLVHRQRDRVGFVAFDDDIVEHVPPSAKHMETVLHVLDRLKPSKPGNLRAPLHKLAEHFGRRGMLVVISDFYEEPDAMLEALGPLRFRGNDLIVFHVLDPRRARVRLRRRLGVRGPRERRADPDRAADAARGIQEDDPRPRRGDLAALHGEPDRLHACSIRRQPLDHALFTLSLGARAPDEGPVDVVPDAPLPARPRRDRRPGDHPPDPEGAEERRRVPVVDVPAADPVRVGEPAARSATGRCCCCGWPRWR